MTEVMMFVDCIQYWLYGDSDYNLGSFMEVPFQGSNLSNYEKALNQAMSKMRVTIEWRWNCTGQK